MAKKKEAAQKADTEVNKTTEVLESAKGRFTNVVVIGLDKNGAIDVMTDSPTYPVLHYLLNRAEFELLLHEKSSQKVGTKSEG